MLPNPLPWWQLERPHQVSWVQTLNLRGPSCRNLHKQINKDNSLNPVSLFFWEEAEGFRIEAVPLAF